MPNPPKPLELRAIEAKGDGQDLSHRKAKPITYYVPASYLPSENTIRLAREGNHFAIREMEWYYGPDWDE